MSVSNWFLSVLKLILVCAFVYNENGFCFWKKNGQFDVCIYIYFEIQLPLTRPAHISVKEQIRRPKTETIQYDKKC